MTDLTGNVHPQVDAQSTPAVDSLFANLSYAEKTELSAKLLRGLTQAGKLAVYCRGDYNLWTAAAAVQSELSSLQMEIIGMSLAGYWDGELIAMDREARQA